MIEQAGAVCKDCAQAREREPHVKASDSGVDARLSWVAVHAEDTNVT